MGAPGLGRENIKIFLLFPGGRGRPPAGWGWFCPLLRGTRQARMKGGGGPRGLCCDGVLKKKRCKKKGS